MDRKSKKPVMEKRRRARINTCLVDLKTLLLESFKRDPSQSTKLEKADILEMTVHLLRSWQRQELAAAASLHPKVLELFQSGWAECAMQVAHYTNSVDALEPGLKVRLLKHMDACYKNIDTTRQCFTLGLPAGEPKISGNATFPPPVFSNSTADPLAQFNPNFSPWKLSAASQRTPIVKEILKPTAIKLGVGKLRKHSQITPESSESDGSSIDDCFLEQEYTKEAKAKPTYIAVADSESTPIWRPW